MEIATDRGLVVMVIYCVVYTCTVNDWGGGLLFLSDEVLDLMFFIIRLLQRRFPAVVVKMQ